MRGALPPDVCPDRETAGLAVFETIYSTARARRGDRAGALAMDRRCQVIFPLGLVVALMLATVRALMEG